MNGSANSLKIVSHSQETVCIDTNFSKTLLQNYSAITTFSRPRYKFNTYKVVGKCYNSAQLYKAITLGTPAETLGKFQHKS